MEFLSFESLSRNNSFEIQNIGHSYIKFLLESTLIAYSILMEISYKWLAFQQWVAKRKMLHIGIYLCFDSGRSYIKQMYHLHPFLSFLCANEIFPTLFHIIWIFQILLRLEMTFQMWKVFFEYRIKRDMTKIGVYRLKGNFQMNWATLEFDQIRWRKKNSVMIDCDKSNDFVLPIHLFIVLHFFFSFALFSIMVPALVKQVICLWYLFVWTRPFH